MTADAGVPRYRELPFLDGLGVRHSRGILPPELGTLSFLQERAVANAASLIRKGVRMPLNLPVDAFSPPLFGRAPIVHQVLETSRNDAEDIIDAFNPQASSQLDGLAHIRARESGYYDGSTDLASARESLGMHHWATSGIAGRAVLLDIARFGSGEGPFDPFDGRGITPADLEEVASKEQVELQAGDVLLIRTRWALDFIALSVSEQSAVTGWSGLVASEEMAEFLWDHMVSLVGSDNPAVENAPGDREVGSLHRRLLPALGMPLMELLDLERLSSYCARTACWEFFFISVPLNIRGAVSSPANAMAIL